MTAAPPTPKLTTGGTAPFAGRRTGIRATDIVALLIGNAALILAMWVRHGGLDQLSTTAGIFSALGQVSALFGTYLALVQLLLMARIPWLEAQLGMDRLAWAHRWFGFACLWLLVAHGLFTTVGYALSDRAPVLQELWTLLTTYEYVLMGTVGFVLFVAVAVSSVRAARRRLSYETWYGIHLYAYLAIALAFLHQVVVGADFIDDPVAIGYWSALYVVTAAALMAFRVGTPVARTLRHRFRVARVVHESDGTVSLYITGRGLDRLPLRAGQYFIARFLTRRSWWKAHPFSISAAPNGAWIRLTVKDLGDHSGWLQGVRPGMRVFLEGPYGALTGARRTRRRVLLVAGGIGITPLRALFEELPADHGDITLLYRARSWSDVVFRDELVALARLRGATLRFLVGQRGTPEMPDDPLAPDGLATLVPDVRDRDVFLCGPDGMMDATRRSLRALDVPASHIHLERFAY